MGAAGLLWQLSDFNLLIKSLKRIKCLSYAYPFPLFMITSFSIFSYACFVHDIKC